MLSKRSKANLRKSRSFILSALLVFPALVLRAEPIVQEGFRDLSSWKEHHFEKIAEHSEYVVTELDGRTCLKTMSKRSASALVCTTVFNVRDYALVSWSWRVENVYEHGDATKKSGDDYPARLYVMFKYDPDFASLGERIKYKAARAVYGEYPPYRTLNYIWANRPQEQEWIPSAYTESAMLIPLREGDAAVGQWVDESVDIVADYRKAFGKEPPPLAQIAIMNDSDNTGESSVSYFADIVVQSANDRNE